MCGIAVAIDWPDAEIVVQRLIGGILHRGDVTDPVVRPVTGSAMCTRRLRIVDADRAVQPQRSFDGRLHVALNGEIYNHSALRRELEQRGIRFKTESDTEVLANALRVWGHKALERLSGMFAFVAVDAVDGSFLAARDPFGVKPLYVMQSQSGFLFCSEMTPLLKTVEQGDVLLLPPGYLLTHKTCARYRTQLQTAAQHDIRADPAVLDGLLSEAVRSRLPENLPCALMFSGGIDSTLVAHYARRHRGSVPGYFVGLPEAPDYRYAAIYREATGFDLRVIAFDPNSAEAFSLISEAVEACESFEPNVVRGAICSYVAARHIHEDGYRVALCGEGADELFCGYQAHELAFAESDIAGFAVRDECLELMHRTSLQRVDRCSMRFRLEMREPFLDLALAGYALSLDRESLMGAIHADTAGKKALRQIYDLYPAQLPASIRNRRKVPLDEGAGLDVTRRSGWNAHFDEAISDRDFEDGRRAFAPFVPQTKEELYYLRQLSGSFDVFRVPHLRGRAWLTHQFKTDRAASPG